MLYIDTTVFHLAIKKNEILIHTFTWMNLENTVTVKEAKHKKPPLVSFHLYEMSRTGESIEIESELVVRGWGEGGMGVDC